MDVQNKMKLSFALTFEQVLPYSLDINQEMCMARKNSMMKSSEMDERMRKEHGGDAMREAMHEMASGKMSMRVHPPKLPKMPPMSKFLEDEADE